MDYSAHMYFHGYFIRLQFSGKEKWFKMETVAFLYGNQMSLPFRTYLTAAPSNSPQQVAGFIINDGNTDQGHGSSKQYRRHRTQEAGRNAGFEGSEFVA